jgi:hypothetical protein
VIVVGESVFSLCKKKLSHALHITNASLAAQGPTRSKYSMAASALSLFVRVATRREYQVGRD